MMETIPLAVITAIPDSGAALFVHRLGERGFRPAQFLIDQGAVDSRTSFIKARLKKVRKRGILGPLLSRRLMRATTMGSLLAGREECARLGIPVLEVSSINSPEAIEVLIDSPAAQALSLGNRYMKPHVLRAFARPIFNLHHGAVPAYRGGPPVFWEIHDGLDHVGYTLHRIDEGIDTGPTLLAGRVPIHFGGDLSQSLSSTWSDLLNKSIDAIVELIATGFPLGGDAQPQTTKGMLRTSPRVSDLFIAARMARARKV